MQPILTENMDKILSACQQHGVKELYAFGSAVRDDFNDASDVDFLADFRDLPDPENLDKLTRFYDNIDHLKEQLETILGRDVDLLQERWITNKYLRYFIDREKKLIYAAA